MAENWKQENIVGILFLNIELNCVYELQSPKAASV